MNETGVSLHSATTRAGWVAPPRWNGFSGFSDPTLSWAAACLGVGYRPLPPSCPAGPKIPPGCFWVVQKALKKYPPSAMDGCGDGGECGGQLGTKRGGKGDFLFSAHPVPQHCGVASIFSNSFVSIFSNWATGSCIAGLPPSPLWLDPQGR